MEWPPRITVATIVQRNGKYLFVEEFDNGRLVLNQPAGHLEPGETIFEAAVRETLEETAWRVNLSGVCGIYHYISPHNGVPYHRIAFTAAPVEQLPVALDPDIQGVRWLALPELESFRMRSPMVRQCVLDAADAPAAPLSFVKHLA